MFRRQEVFNQRLILLFIMFSIRDTTIYSAYEGERECLCACMYEKKETTKKKKKNQPRYPIRGRWSATAVSSSFFTNHSQKKGLHHHKQHIFLNSSNQLSTCLQLFFSLLRRGAVQVPNIANETRWRPERPSISDDRLIIGCDVRTLLSAQPSLCDDVSSCHYHCWT